MSSHHQEKHLNARATKRKSKDEMTDVVVSSLILQLYRFGRVVTQREILFALGLGHVLELIP